MNELTTTEPQQSAISIIQSAITSGVAPETLRELLAVRREWEADEARKAFHLAIAKFQSIAPIVEKGDKAHDKEYARMDRIWRAVRPITSELGLSVTWQVCELKDNGICHVEGNLGHAQGHSVRLAMDVPLPDIIRGQNKAQQMGSGYTYAQRYAFCAALGIVTGNDDDGNAAGGDNSAQAKLERMKRGRDEANSRPAVTDVADSVDEILMDFLTAVNDATSAEELTPMVDQVRDFDTDAKQATAKTAIRTRAAAMGVVWDKTSNSFIKK